MHKYIHNSHTHTHTHTHMYSHRQIEEEKPGGERGKEAEQSSTAAIGKSCIEGQHHNTQHCPVTALIPATQSQPRSSSCVYVWRNIYRYIVFVCVKCTRKYAWTMEDAPGHQSGTFLCTLHYYLLPFAAPTMTWCRNAPA